MASTRAYSVDPRLFRDYLSRIGDLNQTLRVLQSKVRYERPGQTGTHSLTSRLPLDMRHLTQVKMVTDVDQLQDLVNEARGELELIIETIGHMVDRNL